MNELVILGKILSDINRVQIITLLKRERELCVCEICDTLQLSQPLVSRHLKQMREALVVQTEQMGKWKVYSLVQTPTISFLFKDIKADKLPDLISCSSR